ncbi:MAG: hypothetical protein WBM09_11695 [Gallionella sp.]
MSKESCSKPGSSSAKWYASPLFALVLFLVSVLACLVLAGKASIDSETKMTRLVLKREGCDFLKSNGVAIQDSGTGNGCAVLVTFRQSLFGNGGLISLDKQQIRIADDQVVIIGSIKDMPWTAGSIWTDVGLVISMLAMFGSLIWMLRLMC